MKYRKVTPHEREVEAIEYVKNEIAKGRYPSFRDLDKKFNFTYFCITRKKIYSKLGISFLDLPWKRPNKCNPILRKELIGYVKSEIKKGHYPSRRELEKKLRVKIGILFGGIDGLYAAAGSQYIQKNDQGIKKRKADVLMDLVLHILPRLHLELVKHRSTRETGIDILAKDKKGKNIGIELKAYNKYEKVKQRDINQIKNFLIKEKLDKGILITTTSRVQSNLKIPSNIKIILFDDFLKYCNKDMMYFLNFVRSYSIHRETYEKQKKRNEIVEYLRNKIESGEKFTINEMCKDLNLHFYTYFESVYDAFKEAGILISSRNMGGMRNEIKRKKAKEELLSAILDFVKEEVKKGHYPSEQDIKNKFGIGCLRHFTKMSDLYRKLGLPTYLERETRKRIVLHTS